MNNLQLGDQFTECTRLGILHSPSGRFLTAEVFNNEINVSGTALRKRQMWTLLVHRARPEAVYLQSHLGRFLSADKDGRISGAAKQPGTDERFLLEFSPQATGEWAFRSEAYGYYLSGSDAQVSCFSKSPVWWAVRLAFHPQIHLRHQFRSRYLRMLPDKSELRADLPQPWSAEALLWLEQPPMATNTPARGGGPAPAVGRTAVARLGKVAFRTETGEYLRPDGSLSPNMEDTLLFTVEVRSGNPSTYAFRDASGAYLTTVGPGSVKVKSVTTGPGREDLFLLERAGLQVGVLAHNGKYASVKQGVEISANQHEMDETAIFQLEYIGGRGFNSFEAIVAQPTGTPTPGAAGDSAPPLSPTSITSGQSATNGMVAGIYCLITGHWRLRSRSGKLWRMAASSSVQNSATDKDPDSLFEILTLADEQQAGRGRAVMRTNTAGGGQSVSARKLGAVSSSGRIASETEAPAAEEVFRFILVDRPSIVLISVLTGGFLCRGKQNWLDCSGVVYEQFRLMSLGNGAYQVFAGGPATSYSMWTVVPDGSLQLRPTKRNPDDPQPQEIEQAEPGTEFVFHFLGHGRFLIRAVGGPSTGVSYVKAEIKGEVKVEAVNEVTTNCIWEM